MQSSIDNYFITLPEPYQSTLMFLRNFFIESLELSEQRKYNTPFYYYKDKWFAFISYNPQTHEIYISFVKGFKINHPELFAEGRKQQKIYRINAKEDIDTDELSEIVAKLKQQY